ncbi:MAG: hypothetical protein RLZZ387_4868 [Chloroflexota bacterium]
MHAALRALYDQTLTIYRDDERILGAWEFGSLGKGTGDEFSDVDPVFVVRDEDFVRVDAELRPLFERLGARVALWWPEGFNSDDIKNYAILFEVGSELLQYDMTIAKVCSVRGGFGRRLLTQAGGVEVLFDKAGVIAETLAANPTPRYEPTSLRWDIDHYWVYVYIHVKYARRGDVWRLRYTVQTLFQIHMTVLHALYPGAYWGWWPWSVKHVLSPEERAGLEVYFEGGDAPALVDAIGRASQVFARDARRAAAACGVEYPADLEAAVWAYGARHAAGGGQA